MGCLVLVFLVHLLNFLQISRWSRVDHFYFRVNFVPVVDHLIQVEVIDLSLGKREIAAEGQEYMVIALGQDHLVDQVVEVVHFLRGVVLFVFFVKSYLFVVILVKTEPSWPAVLTCLLRHQNGKNVFLSTEIVLSRSPNLELGFVLSLLQFLICINPGKKHRIKSNIPRQSCQALRYSKRINLPRNLRLIDTDLFLQKPMSCHVVIY